MPGQHSQTLDQIENERLAEAITTVAWETFGGNQQPAELWQEFSDRITEIIWKRNSE